MTTPPGFSTRARCRISIATTAAILLGLFSLSRAVRAHAAEGSHELPTPEAWVVEPTPTSAARLAAGRESFLQTCAHCHGADATGDEGPDLHHLEVSDRYIMNTVSRGIKGEMPSFRKAMKPGDYAALTAYLRSLE